MAYCKNHPQDVAAGRCAGCAEEYCSNCLLDLNHQVYCGSCKLMALEGKVPTAVAAARETRAQPSPAANKAFSSGLAGFFFGTIGCFYVVGIVCGISAIKNGIEAHREGSYLSRMARFKSTAAIVFGSLGILMNILNLLERVMHSGR